MRARADGADDLVRLRRREDEHDVLGRLLDDLQQGVEALRRDHVRLVEDEDLVPVARRGERRALAQVTGVVDAAVAGGVDLDDVERARPAAGELDARGAHAARDVRRPLGAVEAAREDAGRRRLAAAARAAEQVRVVDAAVLQGLHQRDRDVLLADHLAEGLGPVAPVQGCRHPGNSRRRLRRPPASVGTVGGGLRSPAQSARTTVSASTDRSGGRLSSVAPPGVGRGELGREGRASTLSAKVEVTANARTARAVVVTCRRPPARARRTASGTSVLTVPLRSGSGALVRHDEPVAHLDAARAPGRDVPVVRDDDERGTGGPGRLGEHAHHLGAGRLVERAGRLVREDDVGPRDERAGDGDALRLAAGQLAGAAVLQAGEPERTEPLPGVLDGLLARACRAASG